MNQIQSAIPTHFTCKKSLIYLKYNQSLTPNVEACICGSIVCLLVPKIFDFGKNANQSQLFFTYREDSEIQRPIIIIQEKSTLMVAGKGEKRGKCFNGQCNVCCSIYSDYLKHIQSVYHKNNVRKNQYTHLIAKLAQMPNNAQFFQQSTKRSKRRGQFVNKNGTNKKIRYFSRSLVSGKFQKRNKQ